MPSTQVAGVSLNECGKCRGLWVAGDHFDVLVTRAAEARRAGQAVSAPRVTGANPTRQSVRYRKCPECDGFMNRRNYQKSSGVIIDVCKAHGTWLDADELEQIAGFILNGGRSKSGPASPAAAPAPRPARPTAPTAPLHMVDAEEGPGERIVGSLFQLLRGLLD